MRALSQRGKINSEIFQLKPQHIETFFYGFWSLSFGQLSS